MQQPICADAMGKQRVQRRVGGHEPPIVAPVLIYAVIYGGADWAMRTTQRRKEG